MSTTASWFAGVTQARQAVLDLLTSGIPRQDISVVIHTGGGEQDEPARTQPQLVAGEDREAVTGRHLPDFVEALAGVTTLTLPESGPVVAAGPLADALVSTKAGGTDGGLQRGLVDVGVAEAQAHIYVEQLRDGGALLVVRSDDRWDTIVYGVFRHNANPILRKQEELVGPMPGRELAADEVGGTISTSIGALTGGMIPGGWGEAGAIFEDRAEYSDGDAERPREP